MGGLTGQRNTAWSSKLENAVAEPRIMGTKTSGVQGPTTGCSAVVRVDKGRPKLNTNRWNIANDDRHRVKAHYVVQHLKNSSYVWDDIPT